VVVRILRQALVHEIDAAAVEERPLARDRHEHDPATPHSYAADPVPGDSRITTMLIEPITLRSVIAGGKTWMVSTSIV
jgi:hypothetical protein